ncbi:MAG TPA: hypothetical protein VLE73_02960 [Candidatus Saccharimonadales bacterium]|nr:hypothetical protein [Candidatus Saccharimonadales bacterium]
MFKGILLSLLFASVPSSSNYTLQAYDVVNGGGASSSTSYGLRSAVGAPGDTLSSTNYKLPAGVKASMTASVPPAPTFSNIGNSYTQLKLTLNTTGFPTDYKYLIAISDDGFTTTKYVQPDQTIGTGLSISNYQSYAAWGGSSGFFVLGLTSSTTYTVKVAALQGDATGSGFGPTASASTVAPSVTFAVSTSATSTPPFTVNISNLTPGNVVSGTESVTTNVTTNAVHGGAVLIKDANTGIRSSTKSFTLSSATANLTSASTGYGAQVTSTSQSSGGPMLATSPFDGSSNSVGGLTTSFQQLATFSTAVTSGSATLGLKAKTDISIPSSTDFSDTLTLSISLLF